MSKHTPRPPVEYIVLEKSLIGNELFEAGQTCKYDGLPAENLQPTCDEGRARYQEYLDSNAQRIGVMNVNHAPAIAGGSPEAFVKLFAAALAEANAAWQARFDALQAGGKTAKANKAEPAIA